MSGSVLANCTSHRNSDFGFLVVAARGAAGCANSSAVRAASTAAEGAAEEEEWRLRWALEEEEE
jgi:hypothetical protein